MHLAPGDFDHDSKGRAVFFRHIIDFGTNNFDSVVLDIGEVIHLQIFKGSVVFTAEFHRQVFLAHPFPFKCRTISDRNGNLVHLKFQTTHFNRPLRHIIVRNVGNYMFIGADTGWENLRDIGIGYHRETEVDSTGCSSVFFIINFTQGEDEGMNSFFVIQENFAGFTQVSGLNAAESHSRPGGESQGEDGSGNVPAIRDEEGVPVHLHILGM